MGGLQMIRFVLGMFIGGIIGIFIICLCQAAKDI
jgi:hypothetical protein